ncbi:uncharacterized protein LOC129737516 [Falco cherrug]|uniref:uncharacterized protein LOC129737516 n=1 Tax=Falco cherrug TaxID=345164 RepID=UPI002478770F|nr:uncharacterized protein LOC129737516 [Falco cherrug]
MRPVWDLPWDVPCAPELCSGMHPVPSGHRCVPRDVPCTPRTCVRMCLRCTVHWMCPRMSPGCTLGCSPGCHVPQDVSQMLCHLSCAPPPSQLVSPGSSPPGVRCMGYSIIGVGGCVPLDPPVSSRAGWGCRQGGDCPHSPAAERDVAHPAASRAWAAPEGPNVLWALTATSGLFSRSHICPTSWGTAAAPLPPTGLGAMCQHDGHPAASASLSVTPAGAEGQGCRGVNHCQGQPGRRGCEKPGRSQGCSPFIPRIPRAPRHRGNRWQGRVRWWPMGWGHQQAPECRARLAGCWQGGGLAPATLRAFSSGFLGVCGHEVGAMEDCGGGRFPAEHSSRATGSCFAREAVSNAQQGGCLGDPQLHGCPQPG